MNDGLDRKRLFFGMEAIAPWPDELPRGRILREGDRHLTLAFLGDSDFPKLTKALDRFPKPPFKTGIAACFEKVLFLPHKTPRVAAWEVLLFEESDNFSACQKMLVSWLAEQGFAPRECRGAFLPHVTLARAPFAEEDWKKKFQKLPLFLQDLHLYESLGHSEYKIVWSCRIPAPFEELEHTADIAFRIRGASLNQIYLHAQLALSFHFPLLLPYFDFSPVGTLDGAIEALNRIVAKADEEVGCPFKAVSFHGTIQEKECLEWEMIVDV